MDMKSKICDWCWRVTPLQPTDLDFYQIWPGCCKHCHNTHRDSGDTEFMGKELIEDETAMGEVESLLWTIFNQSEINRKDVLDGVSFKDVNGIEHEPVFDFIIPEYRLAIDFPTDNQMPPSVTPETPRYLLDPEDFELRKLFTETKNNRTRDLNYRWLCLPRNAHAARNELIRYVNEFYILQQQDQINLLTPKLQGDAGWDIVCDSEVVCPPLQGTDIPSTLYLEIPNHLYAIVQARSSTSKRRLLVLPGVIDPSYRGRIYVMAYNLTTEPITVKAGERIAQLLFFPRIPHLHMQPVTALRPSERGENGFGSTGR
jgi:dUTP pyrophosphatase